MPKTINQLQVITLEELGKRWSEQTGEMYSMPPELQSSWNSYCKVKPHAWYDLQIHRKQQLVALGLYETHKIDFYETAIPPLPTFC
jgi:hypothetical protein